jgi:hypothetical protein
MEGKMKKETYTEEDMNEVLKCISSACDMAEMFRICGMESESFAAYISGAAVGLERLLDPVLEFVVWAEKNLSGFSASKA